MAILHSHQATCMVGGNVKCDCDMLRVQTESTTHLCTVTPANVTRVCSQRAIVPVLSFFLWL